MVVLEVMVLLQVKVVSVFVYQLLLIMVLLDLVELVDIFLVALQQAENPVVMVEEPIHLVDLRL